MDAEAVDGVPLGPPVGNDHFDTRRRQGEVNRALRRLTKVTEFATVDEGVGRARRGRFGEPQSAAPGGGEPALPAANTLQFK